MDTCVDLKRKSFMVDFRIKWEPFVKYLNHDIDKFREFSDWNYNYPDSDIRPRFDRTYS